MMFGEAHAPDADVAELREPVAVRARGEHVSAEPHAGAGRRLGRRRARPARHRACVARRSTAGRSWASRASTATASARWRRSIAGQRRPSAGEIRLAGRPITRHHRLGAPADGPPLRHRRPPRRGGRRPAGRVSINLVLKRIGQKPYWSRGTIDRAAIDATARELIEEFDIRTPSPQTRIGKLSGGNIQKAIIAREVAFEPRVVVFNKPTHGLDVRTTARRAGAHPHDDPTGCGGRGHLQRPGRAHRRLRPGGGARHGSHRRASWTTARARRRASAS